jgi:hypothetical protein
MQLAQHLPHWQIDGFDISGDQYPYAAWVSPNISLYEHDAFQPFQSEYHGKYDIVNLRFFMTLLNGQNLNQVLQNVMALLSMCISPLLHIDIYNLQHILRRTRWSFSMARH